MIKVIIADDEKLICRLVQALADWDALGMEVVGTAENGLEALKLVQSQKPDILITDIRMPGCDGLELIRRAKEINPRLEVIIISGYAHFDYAQNAIKYGVGTYLLKPINKDELQEALQKMRERCENHAGKGKSGGMEHQNNSGDLNRLRSSLVKDLLLSNPPVLSTTILRDTYHFQIRGDTFQVFLLKMDCDTAKIDGAPYNILQEKIREIFEKSLSGVCPEFHLYFQDYTGYGILNYQFEQKADIRKKLRACLNLLEAQKELYGAVVFSISFGKTVTDCAELPKSLEEAKLAIMERLVEGPGRILEGVPEGSGIKRQNLLDNYMKATEYAIDTLNVKEATAACETLYQTSMETNKICGREIYNLVLSAGHLFMARCVAGNVEEMRQEFDYQCRQCCHAEDLFKKLEQLLKELILKTGEQRKSEEGRPVRIAKQYVMEHFQEPITLDEVCDAVGFSSSYFSVLFKKETGESFTKYLTKVRMDEAKRLLRETGLPVAEICEKVGYSDRKHFTSTFHKVAGLNPAEYRKLYG